MKTMIESDIIKEVYLLRIIIIMCIIELLNLEYRIESKLGEIEKELENA